MANGMFRSDNLEGTHDGKYLVSFRVATNDLDNGNVVKVGALKTGERDVRDYSTPAATDVLGEIAIIGTPEVDKAKKYNTVGEFTNKVGSLARGYILVKGDFFSINADAITAADNYTYAVGTTVFELQAGTKLKAVDSVTSGSTKVGDLVAIETEGATTWYVICVA